MTDFSRSAWESWQDIFWGVDGGLIEPPSPSWAYPNNPWVIEATTDIEGQK